MTFERYSVDLPDLQAMDRFAGRIAKALRIGDVVALEGDLGSGKTTLARAVIKALGYRGEVPSPSFTLIETYDAHQLRIPVAHCDFYRLADARETAELGLEDHRAQGVLLAEWPQRVGGFGKAPECLAITLEFASSGRRAAVSPGADWLRRLP